ncbi:hypothetical protein [Bradyrhizobium zhanjiangense]|nr:hypothetical protein [Bradyrhizobium zhanjiangense]
MHEEIPGGERDQQLTQQARIRRGSEQPPFVRAETARRGSYPHSLVSNHNGRSATLKYRRSRWSWLAEEVGVVRYRELFCWVMLGKQRVSAFQLFEYELSPLLDNQDFVQVMDAESSIECELAEVLCEAWDWFSDEVSDYGNLLDFRMAWTDPEQCPHGLWCKAANDLIAHEFPRHALLTMKAFPLEYEGRAPRDAKSHVGLLSRRRAMVKYYKRQFGVNAFPGPSGSDGWLYKINKALADVVLPPRD